MKFIFRTDVHIADHPPASWKGDYLEEILDDLLQIGQLAQGATAVLDGGDFFHVKAATRNSHSLVARVALLHAGYPCPVYAIEGNHDLMHNNLESINKQPLGVLFATGVFRHLRDEVFEEGDLRVRIVGLPYVPERKPEDFTSIRKMPGDTHLIIVAHVLASLEPSSGLDEMFGEPVLRYRDLVADASVIAFGHWHKDQGIQKVDDTFFVNQGSVSRGALVQENLTRVPKVAVIEITSVGVTVTEQLLEVAPASEIFDLEKKERQDSERDDIEQFVVRLKEETKIDPSTSIESYLNSMEFANDVRNTALEYLERARLER